MNATQRQLLIICQGFAATAEPVTGDELADWFNVTPMTIRRDIDALRALGADIRGSVYGYTCENYAEIYPRALAWLTREELRQEGLPALTMD